MRQPVPNLRLAVLLLATLSACTSKQATTSNRTATSEQDGGTNADGTAYVDEDGSASDDGFVTAATPTQISGTNLALRAYHRALALLSDTTYTVEVVAPASAAGKLAGGAVQGSTFTFPVPAGEMLRLTAGDRAALVAPTPAGSSPTGFGVVVNPKATAAARLFEFTQSDATGRDLAQRGVFDTLELVRLGALVDDVRLRHGDAIADADLASIASAFVAANADTVSQLEGAGASETDVVASMRTTDANALTAAANDAAAGTYRDWTAIERNRAATVDAHQTLAPSLPKAATLAASAALVRLAGNDSTGQVVPNLLKIAAFRTSVAAITAVATISGDSKTAMCAGLWKAIDASTDAAVLAQATGEGVADAKITLLTKALEASGGDDGKVAQALAAAAASENSTTTSTSTSTVTSTSTSTGTVTGDDGSDDGATAGNGDDGAVIDPVIPTATLSFSVLQEPITNGDVLITAVFSTSVQGLSAAKISVVNGVAGPPLGSGKTYAFSVHPSADGLVNVKLLDDAGTTPNGAGSKASNTLSFTYDGTPPIATLSGAPVGISSDTAPTVLVSGSGETLAAATFKVGPTSTTNCASVTGYSSFTLPQIPFGSGLTDGATTLCVRGRDAAGNWQPLASATQTSWTVDVTPPPRLGGFTLNDGVSDGKVGVILTWPGDTSDYQIVDVRRTAGGTPPGCNNGTLIQHITTISGIATGFQDVTGSVTGDLFSYRVCIYDIANHVTSSDVGSRRATDTQPPPDVVAFTAATGTTGTIDLDIDLPADTSDYAEITVRRLAGGTAPNADCNSDGTVIKTYTAFTVPTITFSDAVTAGTQQSYRACVRDTTGNLTAAHAAMAFAGSAGSANVRYIFVTSTPTLGNMAGISGATTKCETDGNGGGASSHRAEHWQPILSLSTGAARNYVLLPANAEIRLVDNTTVLATSAADFWGDGGHTLSSPPNMDENGAVYNGPVWTGTTSDNCGDFTLTSGNGDSGGSAYVNSRFLDDTLQSCSSSLHLYCISRPTLVLFVTSALYSGDLGGRSGADAKCAALAASGTDSSVRNLTWTALLTDSNATARSTLPADARYENLEGSTIAETTAQLFNDSGATLTTPPNIDENGNTVPDNVWTGGSSSTWCSNGTTDWSRSTSAPPGSTIGLSLNSNSSWYFAQPALCDSTAHLYCIGQ